MFSYSKRRRLQLTAKWIDEIKKKKKRFISPDFRGLGSSPSKRLYKKKGGRSGDGKARREESCASYSNQYC